MVFKTLNIRQWRVVIPFTIWANEIRPIIAPAHCLPISQATKKREEPSVLPELRRWSRESREAKEAVRGKSCAERGREISGDLESFVSLQLSIDQCMKVRKLLEPGRRTTRKNWNNIQSLQRAPAKVGNLIIYGLWCRVLSNSKINPKWNIALVPMNNAYKQDWMDWTISKLVNSIQE